MYVWLGNTQVNGTKKCLYAEMCVIEPDFSRFPFVLLLSSSTRFYRVLFIFFYFLFILPGFLRCLRPELVWVRTVYTNSVCYWVLFGRVLGFFLLFLLETDWATGDVIQLNSVVSCLSFQSTIFAIEDSISSAGARTSHPVPMCYLVFFFNFIWFSGGWTSFV